MKRSVFVLKKILRTGRASWILLILLSLCAASPTFAAAKNITLQAGQTKQLKVNKKSGRGTGKGER